jgi:hypothetical protein
MLRTAALAVLAFAMLAASEAATDFPIWIELDKPQLVTVVIEDAAGNRVRNLVGEMPLPAGKSRLSWDGYDDGVQETPFRQRHDQKPSGDLTRTRVKPGTYRARGLVHDGIEVTYEFTAYSGGNPPWPTKELTGAWMADHSCPLGAVFLPAGSGSPYGEGKAQVLLTSLIAEAGGPLVWVDLDGKTLHRRQLWGWSGANAAAYDAGTKAVPEYYAYLTLGGEKHISVRALKKDGGGIELLKIPCDRPGPREPRHEGHSLAVHDGLLAINIPSDEAVCFVDATTRKIIAKLPMPSPRGLHFLRDGRLLLISGNEVVRYRVQRPGKDAAGKPTPIGLVERTVLIGTGLERPWTLACDPKEEELFVSDWGASHQVKIFGLDGKLRRTIGKANVGRQLGAYDEHAMQSPMGLAVDDRGRLWVAEGTHLPKRISLWDVKTGSYLRSHYGPPKYGGGGRIDSVDKTRFLYTDYNGLMEFTLDWKAGMATPDRILFNGHNNREGTMESIYGFDGPRWEPPGDYMTRIGGRTYLYGGRTVWLRDERNVVWPVARLGGDGFTWSAKNEALKAAMAKAGLKGGTGNLLIAWSDTNGNHKVDAEEFQLRDMAATATDAEGKVHKVSGYRQETWWSDLSMTANWGLHVPAPTFNADGVPIWDLAKARFVMPPEFEMFRFGEHDPNWGSPVWPLPDGWTITGWGWQGWRDGKRVWSYPAKGYDPAPTIGGDVVFPRGSLGEPFQAKRGEAGWTYGMNGEKGNMWLMTSDGLFIQTLGGDMRNTPLIRFPTAERGMVVDAPGRHACFEEEHYNPTLTQTADGEVYLVAGKEHSSIFRLAQFDSIRRRSFGDVTLSAGQLAKLPEQYVIKARRQTAQTLKIEVGGKAPVVDGKSDEYHYWAPVGSAGGRQASVRIHGGNLYAVWQTGDPRALENAGGDFRYLFKRGGAVDLMLQTDLAAKREPGQPAAGDLRLLITMDKGKPVAVVFRQVVAEPKPGDRFLYESPVGSVWFDRVEDVSRHVRLAQSGGTVEISMPLSALGFAPAVGTSVSADFGILRGDGPQVVQRLYWNNLDALIVSDIPSEARLQPQNWGRWNFVDALVDLPTFTPVSEPAGAKPGLSYSRYKGSWDKLPDFKTLTATGKGVVPQPQLVEDPKEQNNFGLSFRGFLRIPADGTWTLITNSNDGSRLWLAETLVVDNDGVHWSQDEARDVQLKAGIYPIRIDYFQRDGGKVLAVRWSGPNTPDQQIPASAFIHVP